ncbi:MAG: DNA adenine methylase [bacterium]
MTWPEWTDLRAPFPWFGGKRRVADTVWAAMGAVDNYCEPFAGSLAVLLARRDDRWMTGAETVNDADSYLSNFWRALAADPDAVAQYADWPVNETDLLARHLWLVNEGKKRIERMEADPEFYDAKVAGWWVWGINSWIGSGWCAGNGPWQIVDGVVCKPGNAGRGVNRQLPHLGNAGRGVNRQLPHLGDAGRGVNRKRPHLGQQFSVGVGSNKFGGDVLTAYFRALAARLRRVRVCCGDWSRVVTDGALAYGDTVGVFLDPPYQGEVRAKDLYRVDDHSISNAVREWAIEHGQNPRYRIVLAGYAAEHEAQMPATWRVHAYSANACYQTANADGANAANRHNERLWFSPGCLDGEAFMPLFDKPKARQLELAPVECDGGKKRKEKI